MRIFPDHELSYPTPALPQSAEEPELVEQLRTSLINDLHLGRLRPGDRLPSIRKVARERGLDHRTVAEAYHALADEGLVEVRGRSGVCVSQLRPRDGVTLKDSTRWVVEVMSQAWTREISLPRLSEIVSSFAAADGLRCACVESNLDQMTAYSAEIEERSGMTVVQVCVESLGAEAAREKVKSALGGVDMVVTSLYHGALVREAADEMGVPCVVLRVNPALVEAVRRRIQESGLTIVAASAEFGERMRLMYREALTRADQLRVVLAGDPEARALLASREPLLLTRAARLALGSPVAAPLVFPHSPTLAPDTVQELIRTIVRLRLSR